MLVDAQRCLRYYFLPFTLFYFIIFLRHNYCFSCSNSREIPSHPPSARQQSTPSADLQPPYPAILCTHSSSREIVCLLAHISTHLPIHTTVVHSTPSIHQIVIRPIIFDLSPLHAPFPLPIKPPSETPKFSNITPTLTNGSDPVALRWPISRSAAPATMRNSRQMQISGGNTLKTTCLESLRTTPFNSQLKGRTI